jgi:argininosuccinate lyase
MYRSRPKGTLDDDVLHFLSSMQHDQSILTYDVLGSEAHAIMLHETGQISRHDLGRILHALEAAREDGSLIQTEGFEDIHEAVEAFVIRKAGADSGGKMHTARSRNDQVVLDIRMKVRDDINDLCAAVTDLVEGLVDKARETMTVPVPLYTHLQQGQIGTFSHILLSYAYALMRDLERLYLCYQRINKSPLGACAIGGSCIPIDRKRTAILLGFDSLVLNSIDATSSRDVFLEYGAILSIMASSSLSRMAEDFIVWSTSEFGYIELADRFSSTSSAMPQKKNPDPLEIVRSKAALLAANALGMIAIVKGLPSGYSRDLQEMKPLLFSSTDTALAALKVMNGVVRSTQPNIDKMTAAAESSYAIALDVAEQLVMKHGVPFRTAHKIVGGLVDRAATKGKKLAALESGEIGSVLSSLKSKLDSRQVAEAISNMTPSKSIQSRKTLGSPAPAEQERMIKELSQNVRNYRAGVQKRIKMVEGAYQNLALEVRKYRKS